VVAIVLGVEVMCCGDDLAIVTRTGLQSKKLNKLMAILVRFSLISSRQDLVCMASYHQNELTEGAQRSVAGSIAIWHFCNVVNLPIVKM
jgi:hypothetical protein